MPSIKDLKTRITSVKSTQQTTKAMKMVSAAKLKRAQDAITSQRPYARKISEMIKLTAEMGSLNLGEVEQRLVGRMQPQAGEGSLLLVVISSDRGLCGGFNSNIIKFTQRWVLENKRSYRKLKVLFVGKRANDFFKTKSFFENEYYSEFGPKVRFASAKVLTDALMKRFLGENLDGSGEFTEIKFVYNEFKNAISQRVMVEDLFPLADGAAIVESKSSPVDPGLYIVRPDRKELFQALLSRHFSAQVFRILLESQASEHGSRMASMESATKNAGEMIRKLTLQYNKQRQASITKELLEIISGSESQKAG
jgi:F-type H+-transporting ATPase subunit gamma